MKLITVVGARPQFIKAAAVSRTLEAESGILEHIVHTGQHYDENLSDVFFNEMCIPSPFRNLQVGSGKHGQQTGRMLAELEQVLVEQEPDAVLVYGDTNSTLAGALAAAKLHIPVAHVEAGVRSYNRATPEEINRVLTDHAAHFLLAPTPTAVANLAAEGLSANTHLVEDVMLDAVRLYRTVAIQRGTLAGLGLRPGQYALATVHRAENTDDAERLKSIVSALIQLASKIPVVLPLHPRTRLVLDRLGLISAAGRLTIIQPVGYLDMLALEAGAAVVATDSGGVQKEACFCGVPCVTMRDETEWPELITAGWNRLAPPGESAAMARAVFDAIGSRGEALSAFGDGFAGRRIIDVLRALPPPRSRPRVRV